MSYIWLLSLPQRVPLSPIGRAPLRPQSSSQETRWERFTTQITLHSVSKPLTFIGCCEMWVMNEQKLNNHFWSQQRLSLFGLAGFKVANLIEKNKMKFIKWTPWRHKRRGLYSGVHFQLEQGLTWICATDPNVQVKTSRLSGSIQDGFKEKANWINGFLVE